MGRRSRGRKEGLVTFFPIHSSLHVCCSVRLIGRGIREPIEREWAHPVLQFLPSSSLSILLNSSISHPDETERRILSSETKDDSLGTNQLTNFFKSSFRIFFLPINF